MKKIFFKTYGCSLNQADSLIMQELLSDYPKASDESDAGIIIVNTCAVKEPTENKIIKYLQDLPKDKKVILTGCLASYRTGFLKKKFKYSLVGCDNIFDIVKVVKGFMKESVSRSKRSKVNVVPISKNEVVEIIPVCQGCLGECSYCATKIARGDLYSYPFKSIISHVSKALKRGVREFWFTAQDLGAYGRDINTNIVDLIREVLKLEGFFKVRLGMMNPKYAIEHVKGLVEVLNNPKCYKFIHLPVQSGSNRILKLMKRDYSREDFIKLCNDLSSKVSDLTISTDVIIGFPTESSVDFNQTLDLIRLVKPGVLNISRYWRRKGTEAAKMKGLKTSIVKLRVKSLKSLHEMISYSINSVYFKRFVNVLIDEEGRGRTDNYKIVKLEEELGDYVKCLITGFSTTSLVGKTL